MEPPESSRERAQLAERALVGKRGKRGRREKVRNKRKTEERITFSSAQTLEMPTRITGTIAHA